MISNHRGSTLIELLFSLSILIIVLGSFYGLTAFLHRDYANQGAFAESLQESRAATSFFQNEIQNAGIDPTGKAFTGESYKGKVPTDCKKPPRIVVPIMEASETVFHFTWDKDVNGDSVGKNEDIQYEWVGKGGTDSCKRKQSPYTLHRDTGGGQQEVALGIETFRLEYFDENGKKLPSGLLGQTDRRKIRKVKLTLRPLIKDKSEERKREWISEIYLKNIG
jgi:type II secretory pathway component PulJ